MGLKDLFDNFININDKDLEEDYSEEEAVEEPEVRVKKEPVQRRSFMEKRTAPQSNNGGAMKVVIVRPEIFDEVANIADHLVQGKTIVLNLETANRDVAHRVVDFMSGAAYALSCKLKKIANNTFIIVPENTDVSGELMLDDFGEHSYYE